MNRHRPLETRYGPAQTGPRLVPVQASWGRSDAGPNRSVPAGADLGRLVPVPLGPGADRYRPVPSGAGAAERPQETLYNGAYNYLQNFMLISNLQSDSNFNFEFEFELNL